MCDVQLVIAIIIFAVKDQGFGFVGEVWSKKEYPAAFTRKYVDRYIV